MGKYYTVSEETGSAVLTRWPFLLSSPGELLLSFFLQETSVTEVGFSRCPGVGSVGQALREAGWG